MERFQYVILDPEYDPDDPEGVVWRVSPPIHPGGELLTVLNDLGADGWELVGIGDLGFDQRAELILKKHFPSGSGDGDWRAGGENVFG